MLKPQDPDRTRTAETGGAAKGDRIAKVIARAGLCSRREAERMIAEGRVRLDGAVLTSPAVSVGPENAVTVDGKPLPAAESTRIWRYHKPKGEVTTARDPQGRRTVFSRLPEGMPRVLNVGRLDLNSEGLLLLTNDGALKRKLELPASGWLRRYRVRVHGQVDPARLAKLAEGTRVGDVDYGPIEAKLERQAASNAWLVVALREGKNREVRRVLEHIGLTVNRLIRIAYGPFQLGTLTPGQVEEVPGKVVGEQLGTGQAPERKIGTARAKPKKNARPRKKSAKPRGGNPNAGPGAKSGTASRVRPGKDGTSRANRRRPL
jgi:23S rRNA pseudouridine2605 synthase